MARSTAVAQHTQKPKRPRTASLPSLGEMPSTPMEPQDPTPPLAKPTAVTSSSSSSEPLKTVPMPSTTTPTATGMTNAVPTPPEPLGALDGPLLTPAPVVFLGDSTPAVTKPLTSSPLPTATPSSPSRKRQRPSPSSSSSSSAASASSSVSSAPLSTTTLITAITPSTTTTAPSSTMPMMSMPLEPVDIASSSPATPTVALSNFQLSVLSSDMTTPQTTMLMPTTMDPSPHSMMSSAAIVVPPDAPFCMVPMDLAIAAQSPSMAAALATEPASMVANDDVAGFLIATRMTFSESPMTIDYVVSRLADMGFDSVLSLAYAEFHHFAAAGINQEYDQRVLQHNARVQLARRRLEGPPEISRRMTVSKWLGLCGIPPPHAVHYATQLQRLGYDSIEQFDDIMHDKAAIAVFRVGHFSLFSQYLYVASQRPSGGDHAEDSEPEVESAAALFEELLPHQDILSPGLSLQMPLSFGTMNERELQLLHEAVNRPSMMPNPCRKGRNVQWKILASNGTGDERYASLARYSAAQLERTYLAHFDLDGNILVHGATTNAHAIAGATRNSEWTPQLIRLLWEVSQDQRCKSGNKTMWEQIAQNKTGVARYEPLARFTNSQLRSRFRTEFGDKRPQSRRNRQQADEKRRKLQHQASDKTPAIAPTSVAMTRAPGAPPSAPPPPTAGPSRAPPMTAPTSAPPTAAPASKSANVSPRPITSVSGPASTTAGSTAGQ